MESEGGLGSRPVLSALEASRVLYSRLIGDWERDTALTESSACCESALLALVARIGVTCRREIP